MPRPPNHIRSGSVLEYNRKALGGEKRLSAVRSFSLTGRTQQVRGENPVPILFEILCELPDRYAAKAKIPAQESGPTTIGFNGAALIQLPVLDAPLMRSGLARSGAARGASAPGAETQPGGPSPRQAGGAAPQAGTTTPATPINPKIDPGRFEVRK